MDQLESDLGFITRREANKLLLKDVSRKLLWVGSFGIAATGFTSLGASLHGLTDGYSIAELLGFASGAIFTFSALSTLVESYRNVKDYLSDPNRYLQDHHKKAYLGQVED